MIYTSDYSNVKNALTKVIYVMLKSNIHRADIDVNYDDVSELSRSLYGVSDTLRQNAITKPVLDELHDLFSCDITYVDNVLTIDKKGA